MTVRLYETPGNNHGCHGFVVEIQPITDTEGVVVSGWSCSSCWQVGHDDSSSPIAPATLVKLPEFEHRKVWNKYGDGFDWGDTLLVNWSNACKEAGFSHNELVDDAEDARPDCTLVRPSELVILERAPA